MMFVFLFVFLMSISTTSFAKDLTILLSSESDAHTINARIFGKYISENLNSQLKYKIVPGAGGLNAANYLYNVAPKDGNTIGVLYKNIAIVGAIGGENVNFDARNFTWLGSVADGRNDSVVLISNKSQYSELLIGSVSVVTADPIKFITNFSNIKSKLIYGYKNPNEVRVSYERKEIDAFISNIQGIKTFNPNWLKTENILIQFGNGKNRHAELSNVPTLHEIIDKKYLPLLDIFETQFSLLRPYVAPPNIPKDKKELLINAFNNAVKNELYQQEAMKIQLKVEPIFHEEASKIVNLTYSSSKKLLDQIK